MNIAIIEDNDTHRSLEDMIVKKWFESRNVLGKTFLFLDSNKFLFSLDDMKYDLLLVDIMMPNMNGMELTKSLREKNEDIEVCFVTGEASFVFDGYKVSALDYILKPIKEEELFKALDKAYKRLKRESYKLIVEAFGSLITVDTEDIILIEAQNKDIVFYISDRKNSRESIRKLISKNTLDYFYNKILELPTKVNFSMPHRSYICNLNFILKVDKKEVSIDGLNPIPIARGRKDEFMQSYFKFLRNRMGDR